jgi:hypothetical protein
MDIFRRAYWLAAASDSAVVQQVNQSPPPLAMSPLQLEVRAEIFGIDGVYVGAVGGVAGDLIKLFGPHAGSDDRPDHYMPLHLVDRVEDGVVILRVAASDVVSFEEGATQYAE